MEKKPLVVGNWKMQLSYKGEIEVMRALKKVVTASTKAEVVVCPSYPALFEVANELKSDGSNIQVGAQHVHWQEKGSWTGSVSVAQIAPFVQWCIVGHSEVRRSCGVTDQQVAATADLLVRHGIRPVVCLGETRDERDAEATVERVTAQIQSLFSILKRTSWARLVITYEPIWAISSNGPSELPDPADVSGIALLIRKLVAGQFDQQVAERLRIIYGGSVTGDTAADYVREPGIDGALVGGASVHPRDMSRIISAVEEFY